MLPKVSPPRVSPEPENFPESPTSFPKGFSRIRQRLLSRRPRDFSGKSRSQKKAPGTSEITAILPGRSSPEKIPGKSQEHPNPMAFPENPGNFLGNQKKGIPVTENFPENSRDPGWGNFPETPRRSLGYSIIRATDNSPVLKNPRPISGETPGAPRKIQGHACPGISWQIPGFKISGKLPGNSRGKLGKLQGKRVG